MAIFGSVLANRLDHYLPRLVPVEALDGISARALTASPERLRELPPAVIEGVHQAFASSLHPVFLLAVPMCIAAFVLALFLKEMPMRSRPSETTNEAAQRGTPVATLD